ncbi:MAG: MraY family glycosyltransferase [Candidatus Acidoferrales bacterium]
MNTYTVLFAFAFLATFIGTPILRRVCTRLGLLDSAITAGVHQRRHVPRLGGVIIYLALGGALLALFIPSNVITEQFRQELPTFWLLWGPATFILLLGVADDIWGMNAWVKFSAQVAAGLWLVSVGIQITHLSLPWGGRMELGWFSAGATLLWVVALTNAFNLIDGLDGLAAGVGFLSASAIAVTAMMLDAKMVVVVSLALAGALLGFLRHNFAPASIFLGDSGSMFVGFVLAASAVVWHQKATTAVAVAAPLLAFALPVADTTLAVVRRTLRGQHWFASDRQHIHHRLVALGLTPRQVVLWLYGFSALAALASIFVARGPRLITGMVLLLFMGACWVGVRRLAYPEFSEFGWAFSRRRVRARLRLQELLEGLRAVASGPELREWLQVAAHSLELERVTLRLDPARRRRLRLLEEEPVGEDNLWRLTLPLGSGGLLVLARRPGSGQVDLPFELVGEELRAGLDEALARLEKRESLRPGVAEAASPAAAWVSSGKEVV